MAGLKPADRDYLEQLIKSFNDFRDTRHSPDQIDDIYNRILTLENTHDTYWKTEIKSIVVNWCRHIRGKLVVYKQLRHGNPSQIDISMLEKEIQTRKELIHLIKVLLGSTERDN
ncbi:MAG: hypothetical protein UU77_C0057G0002 [candidate division WWE3 bacterium GW2011_GWC1_41_7]|uniref:Uncharacterized protein n=3 Tax=Katanobacteria TaxID=422282 RepID=A0A0G0ZKF0_UNCKA|nr:MAG: hypothetical protein UU77_C0057G0002 [candidate division WWE3 bacterium GW2011_GWC1_41_7]KKS22536.1 MAG: hypothetical protein UU80_C0006G0062 [candidate division WWE3 bacterium GW2011_GWA1_41_8]OGC57884.1 MAG: hypothetical protein A2976_03345 [candidate division WWE3 bacterium RIFCSPLOWO2_01_FULL_41_9]